MVVALAMVGVEEQVAGAITMPRIVGLGQSMVLIEVEQGQG